MAGGHAFGGMRSGAGFAPRTAPRAGTRGSFHPPLASRNFRSRGYSHRGYNNSSGLRIRTYGYGNGLHPRCYGVYGCEYGYGYPWAGGGVDPYWWWEGSSYDQDREQQIGLANEMNQQSLDEQRMRQQADQDSYARSAPPAPPLRQAERTQAVSSTVLVFRDQHKEEIQNYAIIGQTLWNFGAQRTEKISLSDLDLLATTRENDNRGVDFRLPASSEGQ